jgi:hypothetical protein
MIRIDAAIRERELQARMTLQVHDELVFEVPETELDIMRSLVREQMEQVHPLLVPLVVEIGVGKNCAIWSEAFERGPRVVTMAEAGRVNRRTAAGGSGCRKCPSQTSDPRADSDRKPPQGTRAFSTAYVAADTGRKQS